MNPLLGIFCLVVLSLNASLVSSIECTPGEGTEDPDRCCQFPFTNNLITYNRCTTDGIGMHRLWCSFDRFHTIFSPWAYCVNSCDDFPCQNGGTCTVTGETTYACHCKHDYYGDNCESENPCSSNPCQHGGTCSLNHEDGSYVCYCDPDWEGQHCEIRHCAPNARTTDPTKCCHFPFIYLAHSYDSCTTRNNDGVQWCAFDHLHIVGQWANCANPCSDFPCQNGGTCSIIDDDNHSCECPVGFEGDNCENATPTDEWTAEGCYKEAKNTANKIFPLKYYTVQNIDLANPDLELIYSECKDRAESAGYGIFGIKSTNKCITTADGALIDDYDRLGSSTQCLTDDDGHGVGTAGSGRSFYCYTRS